MRWVRGLDLAVLFKIPTENPTLNIKKIPFSPQANVATLEDCIMFFMQFAERLVRSIDKRGEIKERPTALPDAFELGKRLAEEYSLALVVASVIPMLSKKLL